MSRSKVPTTRMRLTRSGHHHRDHDYHVLASMRLAVLQVLLEGVLLPGVLWPVA